MTYLRSYLRGSASNAIAALALTNDNYQTALDLLNERYDNKQLLISTHMKNFLKLEQVKDIKNIDALRQVLDNITIQKRSLENLDITANMYGPLLIPVILSKLPDELNLILSREFNDKDCWDITPVLDILKKEIKAREKTFVNSTDDDDEYENIVSKKFTAQTLFTSSKRENNLS